MPDDLVVKDIQALYSFSASLERERGAYKEVLADVEVRIEEATNQVEERILYWRYKVEQLDESYQYCIKTPGLDDCSRLWHALQEAIENLNNAKKLSLQLEDAIAEYKPFARTLEDQLASSLPKMKIFLHDVAETTERMTRKHVEISGATAVSRLADRLEKGIVDLSIKTEWGKFAHQAYQDELESKYPNEVQNEIVVRVTKSDGTVGKGRIDSLMGRTIIDYKTHDLDRFKSDTALQREMKKIADQMTMYLNSPDTPVNSNVVVYFEFPPGDVERRSLIESYFHNHNIEVWWDE